MSFISVRGLAIFLASFRVFCKYQERFGTAIRPHIPSEHLGKFDALRLAASAFCEVADALDIVGDGVGAN